MTDLADINVKRALGEKLTPAEYRAVTRDDVARDLKHLFTLAKDTQALRTAVSALMADTAAYRIASYAALYETQSRLAALEAAIKPALRAPSQVHRLKQDVA